MHSANPFDLFYLYEIVFVVLWFFIMIFIAKWLMPFIHECSYIKMELNRTEGIEYDCWRRKLKRQYLRLIPFVGVFLKK